MTERAIRRAISREVRRALSAAGLSAAAAAAKMPSRPGAKLIYRWTNAEVTAPLDRLDEFATAIGQTLSLRIGPGTAKEPPPDWAEALPDEVAAAVIKRLAEIPEIAQAAAVELGLDGPRHVESPREADAAPRGTGRRELPPPGKRA